MRPSACLAVLAIVLVTIVLGLRINAGPTLSSQRQWGEEAHLRKISENSPYMRNER